MTLEETESKLDQPLERLYFQEGGLTCKKCGHKVWSPENQTNHATLHVLYELLWLIEAAQFDKQPFYIRKSES